jgi:hypothetical protein
LAWVGAEPFQGTYKPALGASAAAAYVKRLSKAEQSVFSDASGGSGLEPSVMRVYFRRPFLAHQNAKRERPYKAYATRAGQLGFLVTRPQSEALVHEFFPGFGLRARVTNAKGRELLGLYSRGKFDTVEQLSAEEGVANYDATYPTICSQ